MWNTYARYTHRWTKLLKKLLKNVKNSKERKQMILRKIREIDKKQEEKGCPLVVNKFVLL